MLPWLIVLIALLWAIRSTTLYIQELERQRVCPSRKRRLGDE